MSAWKRERQARYKARKPWVRSVEWARRRCNDTDRDGPNFPWYKAQGVTCSLTAAEAEIIWKRDNAASMKKPSLDRIDPTRGYHFDNVRFQEFWTNTRRAVDPRVFDESTAEFV